MDTHCNVDAEPINAVISADSNDLRSAPQHRGELVLASGETPCQALAFAVQRRGSSAGASPARQTGSLRPEAIEAT